ncbi:unnamed protein product [Chrysoparadoxa australica]
MAREIKWCISFEPETQGLECMHNALDALAKEYWDRSQIQRGSTLKNSNVMRLVQPAISDRAYSSTPIERWWQPQLNTQQKEVVQRILDRSHCPNPFIIFGPPGTGKTMCVIESILQVIALRPGSKVLACAPSAAAADVLCSRLMDTLSPDQLLRLCWWQHPRESLAAKLEAYTRHEKDQGTFCLPPEGFGKFSVIVTSCGAAALMRFADKRLEFSHIFVDESSQALEPELLVPLSLAHDDTSIILAGDPCQLGATLRSPAAKRLGLGVSMQERLMQLPLYRDPWSRCITKLLCNYRSHPSLLELPSRMFYDSGLVASADREVTESLCEWEELEGRAVPQIFWGIEGHDAHEMNSPSFYNRHEASLIVKLIKGLVNSSSVSVTTADIAVIAAFRAQVVLLRKLLRLLDLGQVSVGQVEDYQGQERLVVIVSTVLSERHRTKKDSRMGFLGDPKRFNVALTRAKALAIVVGNPHLLIEEAYWKDVLTYCRDHGTYRGCDCAALELHGREQDPLLLMQSVLQKSLLGAAQLDSSFPTELDDWYRDDEDAPFRIML